jgi:pyruvate,water dikinase
MGARIETHFGSPQDIEWAIGGGGYSSSVAPHNHARKGGRDALDEGIRRRVLVPTVTSPLFYSWLGEWLSKYVLEEGYSVMGYWELKGLELLRLHKGHIYFNAAVLEGVFTFNPRFSRTKELLNYFPEKDQERIANAKTKILRRVWSEVRIAFKDSDGMITKTDKAYRRWASEFLRKMERFDALDLDAISDQALYDEYASMVQAFLKHFRLIRYGMVTHSIGMNLMAKRWLTDWAGDTTGALYASVVSGLPDNKTIMTNNALIVLARSVRDDPALMGAVQSKPAAEFLEELRSSPSMSQFRERFGLFLKEYGHRSHTREMYFPRWADDPALVVDILRSLSAPRTSTWSGWSGRPSRSGSRPRRRSATGYPRPASASSRSASST